MKLFEIAPEEFVSVASTLRNQFRKMPLVGQFTETYKFTSKLERTRVIPILDRLYGMPFEKEGPEGRYLLYRPQGRSSTVFVTVHTSEDITEVVVGYPYNEQ